MESKSKPYTIVAGIDYSAVSDLALQRAFELASEHRSAEVHVVTIARTRGPLVEFEIPQEQDPVSRSLAEAVEHLRGHVKKRLDAFTEKRQALGNAQLFDKVVTHLRLDAPAEEIAQLASDLEADLVVVGTRSRRGVKRLFLGSVAETVVRLAPCSVLVVRPNELPSVPKIEPPCPRCVETRRATGGAEYWCEQHRERHGQRHTYHQSDRVGGDTNFPLTYHR